jgi:primosomal protein N' (replication factor Y)
VLLCRDCGLRLQCPECSVSLVVHRRSGDLRCHYCGSRSALPAACPSCGGTLLEAVGAGTEKVAHHLDRYFPGVSTVILDRDTVRRRDGLEESLGAFAAGRAQVLVGPDGGQGTTSQRADRRHLADALPSLPDYRLASYLQLLTQVAVGRTRCKPGRWYPGHYPDPAVRHASRYDVDAFWPRSRLPDRLSLPAVGAPGAGSSGAVRRRTPARPQRRPPRSTGFRQLRVRGPAAAPLERIRNRYRWQLLLSAASRAPLRQALDAVEAVPLAHDVHGVVDVDPLTTL